MSDDIKKMLQMLTEGEALTVDEPEEGQLSNEPNPTTLDFKTQADSGDDLHRTKKSFKKAAGGDNPMGLKEGIRNRLTARWNQMKGPGLNEAQKRVTDPIALKVKQMAIEFFDSVPYSTARISGGRAYRISIRVKVGVFLDKRYHYVTKDQVTEKDAETLKRLREGFISKCQSEGIEGVDVKYHIKSGLYASIRVPLNNESV